MVILYYKWSHISWGSAETLIVISPYKAFINTTAFVAIWISLMKYTTY